MFKPMLAIDAPEPEVLDRLLRRSHYSISPKIDGFRNTIQNRSARMRSGNPVPNQHIQKCLAHLPHGLDGELTVGEATAPGVFRATQSQATRIDGTPDFIFHVFDNAAGSGVWGARVNAIPDFDETHVRFVPHTPVSDLDEAMALMWKFIEEGYEGAGWGNEDLPYTPGESRQQLPALIRLTLRRTDEARLLHIDGKAIVLQLPDNRQFRLSAGLTVEDIETLRIGDLIAFSHMPYGAVDLPRQAVFKGVRHPLDL